MNALKKPKPWSTLSLPSGSMENVSLEKIESKSSLAWLRNRSPRSVSREISKNVNQVQELVATNVLDQHLMNTSIPSKKIPTLMTTTVSGRFKLYQFSKPTFIHKYLCTDLGIQQILFRSSEKVIFSSLVRSPPYMLSMIILRRLFWGEG